MKPNKNQNFSFNIGDEFETIHGKQLTYGAQLKGGIRDSITVIDRYGFWGTYKTDNYYLSPKDVIFIPKRTSKFLI